MKRPYMRDGIKETNGASKTSKRRLMEITDLECLFISQSLCEWAAHVQQYIRLTPILLSTANIIIGDRQLSNYLP